MIKFHKKYFLESLLFHKNLDRGRSNPHQNRNTEGKKIIYPEAEKASKCPTPLFRPQYSETFVENKKGSPWKQANQFRYGTPKKKQRRQKIIPVSFSKNDRSTGGMVRPENKNP